MALNAWHGQRRRFPQVARAAAGTNARVLMVAMTSAFALGQTAGPALVAALAGQPRGIAIALAAAAGMLEASALALRPRAAEAR